MTSMKCMFNGKCSNHQKDFAPFDFNFEGGRSYIVTPANYMLDFGNKSGDYCNIAVYGNTMHATEYILGDVFMQNMYVVLDYSSSRFAVNGNFRMVEPKPDNKPVRPDSVGSSVWIIIGIVAGVLVLVAGIGCCIVKMKNKRLQSNLAKYEQL